ncbi:MAG TPA: ABC transporter permease [Phycisphaerae bacterium]|nr:ABC transporter permease [Phycisphaerae bacterium]HRY66393.1 ABC transporter permease [Phycisphaerae bacterium]HSA25900.1 ABC transporter permease [Phycisphaerae bacterium]
MSTLPLDFATGHAGAASTLPPTPETPASPANLPTLDIRPRCGWQAVDFKELLRFHELLYFLVWRDIKVQYKQTVLGPAWAVLRPLANLVVFSFVFGKLAGMPSQGAPYPLFLYAGLLPWTFFSAAVLGATGSLLNNAHLLSKVYFPRVILPTSSVFAELTSLAISFLIYGCMMLGYGYLPGASVALLPVLVLLTVITALGIGYLLAGLTVMYHDVRFVIGSLMGAWMYVSPVIYPADLVPGKLRWLLMINPMTGIIDAYRSALLNQPFNWLSLSFSAVIAVGVFLFGLYFFYRTERHFVDVA